MRNWRFRDICDTLRDGSNDGREWSEDQLNFFILPLLESHEILTPRIDTIYALGRYHLYVSYACREYSVFCGRNSSSIYIVKPGRPGPS